MRTQLDIQSPVPMQEKEYEKLRDGWPDAPAEMWDAASFATIRDVLLPPASGLPPLSAAPLANVLTDTTGAPQLKLVRNLLLPLRREWARRVEQEGAVPVAREVWEDAVALGAGTHECPTPQLCEVCHTSEGYPGFELAPCERCGTAMYCSFRCMRNDADMHRLTKGCGTPELEVSDE